MRNGEVDLGADLAARLPDHFHVFWPVMDVDFGGRDAEGKPIDIQGAVLH
jgi:hypothetical protein